MRERLALLLVVLAAGVGAVAAGAPSPLAASAPSASACTYANLSWGRKCLARGQYCKVDRDREYHRYGFHCHTSSRDSRGNYHLK
jgi:hypothetical protein